VALAKDASQLGLVAAVLLLLPLQIVKLRSKQQQQAPAVPAS
jgi:hypothetical protein